MSKGLTGALVSLTALTALGKSLNSSRPQFLHLSRVDALRQQHSQSNIKTKKYKVKIRKL
jgi:hypothetical protein